MDTSTKNAQAFDSEAAARDWAVDTALYPVEADLIDTYFPPPPARVLDIGCGGGRTTAPLRDRGYQVTAIDFSESLLKVAQQRAAGADFARMDARHLAFPDHTFDAVLFSFNGLDCIFPLAERRRTLAGLHRVLKPGGIFYYTGHNALGALTRGSLFSRAPWRNRWEFLARQRWNPDLRRGFWRFYYPQGDLLLYGASPAAHLETLRSLDFDLLCVRGSARFKSNVCGEMRTASPPHPAPSLQRAIVPLWRLALSSAHVHFVARRPHTFLGRGPAV